MNHPDLEYIKQFWFQTAKIVRSPRNVENPRMEGDVLVFDLVEAESFKWIVYHIDRNTYITECQDCWAVHNYSPGSRPPWSSLEEENDIKAFELLVSSGATKIVTELLFHPQSSIRAAAAKALNK